MSIGENLTKIQDMLKREFLNIVEPANHDVSCFVLANNHKEFMNLKAMPFNFSFPCQEIDRVVYFVLFVVKIGDHQCPYSMFGTYGDKWWKGIAEGCKVFKNVGVDPNDALIHFTVGNSRYSAARRLHPGRLDSGAPFLLIFKDNGGEYEEF